MARIQEYLNRKVAPEPTQEIGIGGFTAFVRVKERYTLEADIPTTPVEDGSYVNDHVILKPLVLRIEGNVSDVHLRGAPLTAAVTRTQAEIGNVASQYGSPRTQAQLQQVAVLANTTADAIRRIDNLLDTGEQAVSFFGNQDAATKTLRERFLDTMEALFYGRQGITIDMPTRSHHNMVITSFVASYDNQADTTEFVLEARQIQYAEVQSIKIAKPAPGLGGQADAPADKGLQSGGPVVEESLLTQILNAATGAE
jgi:hypothetical protein